MTADPVEVAETDLPIDLDAIYLDHAATAPLRPVAAAVWVRVHSRVGNPSSAHAHGRACADILDDARKRTAVFLGAHPDEIVFTSGGTEAINHAVLGTFAERHNTGHLVTTTIEHSAVLEAAEVVRSRGVDVTRVPVTPSGIVDIDAIAQAIRPDTRLISLMHANNETGMVQPVRAAYELATSCGALLHVDAVQTAGKLPLDDVPAHLMSISGHKFGAPRGIGALRVRHGIRISSLLVGGGQEAGRRAGTQNVAGAAAMASAAEEAIAEHLSGDHNRRCAALAQRLLEGVQTIAGVHVNGYGPRLPQTVSLRIDGVRGDAVADALDLVGISVGTGSACHAGASTPSHVLTAMGLDDDQARSTIRISFGSDLGEEAADRTVAAVAMVVHRLRTVAGGLGANPRTGAHA
ncbi:MAG: cysteine desulfurase [Kineosporiaceae bacterium]|nr:cysteine desulfurase [Kineosporiaceae bacterium]